MSSEHVTDDADRGSRLSVALDWLRHVESLAQLGDVLEQLREVFQLGHATFLLTGMGISTSAGPCFVTTYPREWIELYLNRDYFRIDPVIAWAQTSFLPFEWSDLETPANGAEAFFSEARSFGITGHGLTVPIFAPRGERSLLSVTSNLSSGMWTRHRPEMEDDLFVFARHLHDRFSKMSGLRSSNALPSLSQRERQCLELVANGLLFKQIAAELRISESAVRLYIRSAKRKLSAETLSQAMVRATVLDLFPIQPFPPAAAKRPPPRI